LAPPYETRPRPTRQTPASHPFGKITAQIPQFERGILYGDVVPMHNLTPYLQWRSWPLIILCVLLFGWALIASRMAKTV